MGDNIFATAARFGVVIGPPSLAVDGTPARARLGEEECLEPGLDACATAVRRGTGCASDVFLTVVPTGVFVGASADFTFL